MCASHCTVSKHGQNPFRILMVGVLAIFILLWPGASSKFSVSQAAENITDQYKSLLDPIEAALDRSGILDERLVSLRRDTIDVRNNALENILKLEPDVLATRDRLDQLATEDGAKETIPGSDLEVRRTELSKALALISDKLKLAKAGKVRSDQIIERILQMRRSQFTDALFKQSFSLFNPDLWIEGFSGLLFSWAALTLLFGDWGRLILQQTASDIAIVAGVGIACLLVLFGPLRSWLHNIARPLEGSIDPEPAQKLSQAGWIVVISTIIPTGVLVALYVAFETINLLPAKIEVLFQGIIIGTGCWFIASGLARGLLAPYRPKWRVLHYQDVAARKLFVLVLVVASLATISIALQSAGPVLSIPLQTIILLKSLLATSIAITCMFSIRVMVAAYSKTKLQIEQLSTEEVSREASSLLSWRLFLPLIWLASFVVLISILPGFIAFASFLSIQILWVSFVVAILGLILGLTQQGFQSSFKDTAVAGRLLSKSMGLNTSAVLQTGVVLGGLARLIIYGIGIFAIVAPWGLDSENLLTSVIGLLSSFSIGAITIAPLSIIGSIALFSLGLIITRSIQNWTEHTFLPGTSLDPGLKNSIKTALGYVGFILAVVLAFSYIGLNLSSIAIVAGALSVGIGFGLQSIVNNFVSGLILLAERPIKTGDWIVVGNDEGYVKKINVRSTEIQTFDRSTVIVPNSELISSSVQNWMHTNKMGRIKIPVGVSYDADPDEVRDILFEVAKNHPSILENPAPIVYFVGFGDNSLDFQLRAYLGNIDSGMSVKSALRFDIIRRFRAANIEIPYPQRDIHIRSDAPDPKKTVGNSGKKASSAKETKVRNTEMDFSGDDE